MEILYEDKYLTVINKPEGLLSVPYPGSHERTALDVLCDIRRKRGMVHGSYRPLVVHRLDKPTSGIMMFALSPDIKKRIMDNWQNVVTSRLYHAVAENPFNSGDGSRGIKHEPLPDSGTIDLPLIQDDRHHSYVYTADGERYQHDNNQQNTRYDSNRSKNSNFRDRDNQNTRRDSHHRNHEMRQSRQSGFPYNKQWDAFRDKPDYSSKDRFGNKSFPQRQKSYSNTNEVLNAVTHYKILERGSRYTLFELELETGRTNQIRAHLSYLGYPLAGDKTYRAETDPVKRLCLHARTLEFIHPVTGEKLKFEVSEPENWARLTAR